MLSVGRPSSFVSPSLNDIIPKSPSHPFPFIATTSRSPSLCRCIPSLIPSSKSPDDLSEMGSLVNWCVKGRRLYSIHSQSRQQRWGRMQAKRQLSTSSVSETKTYKHKTKTISTTVITSLESKIQSSRSVGLLNAEHNRSGHNAVPVDPGQRGGKMSISSATCDISNNWATPSNWFHPLTHTRVGHGYHQQTSAPPPSWAGLQKSTIWYISRKGFCGVKNTAVNLFNGMTE